MALFYGKTQPQSERCNLLDANLVPLLCQMPALNGRAQEFDDVLLPDCPRKLQVRAMLYSVKARQHHKHVSV